MDFRIGSKSLKEVRAAAKASLHGFLRRSKVPLLMLVYPALSWLLIAAAPDPEKLHELDRDLLDLVPPLIYALVAAGLAYCLALPLWASRYRTRPAALPRALRIALYGTFAYVALLLPAQAAVLALSLHIFDSEEMWVWGFFVLAGSIAAVFILLRSGLSDKPGVYVTLRVKKLDLDEHPRLAEAMRELSEALHIPLARNVVIGLQGEIVSFAGTVFCPDGELEGGVLCLSLPLASILNIAEFNALAGQHLLGLYASSKESRHDLNCTVEHARQIVMNLQASMRDWGWTPKHFIHPVYVLFRLVPIAAMKFHLYLGKEIIVFAVGQFLESRSYADVLFMANTHHLSSANTGRVEVVSGLIKEAAMSLGARMPLRDENGELHPLGEVVERVIQNHSGFAFDISQRSPWPDPVTAWNHLGLRCTLSGLSLPWCLQMAKEVTPEPSAKSLFENVAELERQLVAIVNSPLVVAKRSAASAE